MRFTIVIPARNEEADIETCIESVMSAAERVGTAGDIFVIDDGSSDRTAARAEASGVRVLRHRTRRGTLAAWASGVRASDADVVVFVDADCTLHREALALLLDAIEKPGVGVVSGRAVPVHSQGGGVCRPRSCVVFRSGRFSARLLDQIKARLGDHDFIAIGRLMAVRREAWNVPDVELPHCDRQVTSAARLAGWRAVWVPEAKVYYRVPALFSELRSDWRRTRLAPGRSAQTFDRIPWGVQAVAAGCALYGAPVDGLCWVGCRMRLVRERWRPRNALDDHQPVAWD